MIIECKNMKGEQKVVGIDDIQTYTALPCELNGNYIINGVWLDRDDFGEGYDEGGYCDDEDINAYGCVHRVFDVWIDEAHLVSAMKKYNITQEEYFDIQNKLADILYVGRCGWCV